MNPKIEETKKGFGWRPFAGFSIIFDNGEAHYKEKLLHNDFEKSQDFYQSLYRAFGDFAAKDKVLSDRQKFLPLDFSSWHVTVWDGINSGNFSLLAKEHVRHFDRFMKSLKYKDLHPDLRSLTEKSIRWINKTGELNFVFRKVYKHNDEVLVVSLKPADLLSLDRLHKIKFIRRNINDYFRDSYGFATGGRYLPHTSLGYFVDKNAGKQFDGNIEHLNDILFKSLKNKRLSFSSASLFAFSDMVKFFKLF